MWRITVGIWRSALIRVLIENDHLIFREGLRLILGSTPDMEVKGEAANAQEVLDKLRESNFDVAVLELFMSDRNGLDLLRELKHERPGLPVLVLSMHSEEQFGVQTLKAGASGYLTKDTTPAELTSAIRKVYMGGTYVSAPLAERLALELRKNLDKPPHETLSLREFQVMCLFAKGRSGKEIAQELFLSPKTISTYRARILNKMSMKTNADLIYYGIKNRLVP